jgi:hypothetical protein
MPISIPTEVNRRKAMITLITQLKATFKNREFIGNGAANASGTVGSLVADPLARKALGGGACVEEFLLEGDGSPHDDVDPDHGKDLGLFTADKRWLIEFPTSASSRTSLQQRKVAEGFRLFFGDAAHSFSGRGTVVAPAPFRVAYQNVPSNVGLGVDDLILEPDEASRVKLAQGTPKRVWLYVCVGEVEKFRTSVFNQATAAGLVAQPNVDDPVGDVNVRFWAPQWRTILIDYIKSLETKFATKLPLHGYFLDVTDAWMRADSVWS